MDQSNCVGIIGLGKMGSAILEGMLKRDPKFQIITSARSDNNFKKIEAPENVRVSFTTNNKSVSSKSDVLFLAVKPQTFPHVAKEIRGSFQAKKLPLVISIMAGIRIEHIATELALPQSNIVRSMPNLPGQIRKGLTVWTTLPTCNSHHRDLALAFLKTFGHCVYVESQKFLDIGTALSASGPAYIFLFMEALVDAGVRLGLPRDLSHEMVLQTVLGSGAFIEEKGPFFAKFREAVTSPGGTTAQALYELEKGGIRTVIADAVEAAFNRAIELSQ